jgi:hypothetical protein
VIAGLVHNLPSLHDQGLLLRVSSSGNLLWQRLIGGLRDEIFDDLVELPDRGYLLVGRTTSFGNGYTQPDWFIVRCDSSGNLRWMDTYGAVNFGEYATSVELWSDSVAIVAGYPNVMCIDIGEVAPQSYGEVTVSTSGPPRWEYILHHLHGEIDTLKFTGLWPGVIGHVDGDAAATWTALPGGDGNDGDTVIFVTDAPLTQGSIGMFTLEHTTTHDNPIRWIANDIEGLVLGPTLDLAVEPSSLLPEEIGLHAFPNPFNLSTTLEFTLHTSSHVNIAIFDITGRRVTEILNTRMEAGVHSIPFIGEAGLSSGVYFARMQTNRDVDVAKLLLMK